MIQVANFFEDIPEILVKDQQRCEQELIENQKFNNSCWSRVNELLVEKFFGKCAYCETNFVKNALRKTPTIDHYRPKAKDKYYWLAHEWSNFLPACRYCQKTKDDNFDISGNANLATPLLENGKLDYQKCRLDSEYLMSELPLLLHPVMDKPIEHFEISLTKNLGKINYKTEKGEVSIRRYNLNRANLILERKTIISDFFNKVKQEEIFFLSNGLSEDAVKVAVFELISESFAPKTRPDAEYSFVWTYLVNTLKPQ